MAPEVSAPAPEAPAAETILNKYIEALGGAQRLASLTSFAAKGTYQGYAETEKSPVELWAKAPNQRVTIVHSPKVLRFLADIAGIDRPAIGTDESFPPADHAPLESLRAAGFSGSDIRRIGEENPRRLIPRLNQVGP